MKTAETKISHISDNHTGTGDIKQNKYVDRPKEENLDQTKNGQKSDANQSKESGQSLTAKLQKNFLPKPRVGKR